jgi:hypothetical protein
MMTLKKGLHQPKEPVWGDRLLYSPLLVEYKTASGQEKPVPIWKHRLGFGQQFLMNAAQEEDGVLYFCVGFAMSATCMRDRWAIVFLCLARNAKEKLTAIHKDQAKATAIMSAVQREPIRRYSIGTLIPGAIVPRVLGTILEASAETQRQFFGAVKQLFSPGGHLPAEYHHQNKDEVFNLLPLFFVNFSPACSDQESCGGLQMQRNVQQSQTANASNAVIQ